MRLSKALDGFLEDCRTRMKSPDTISGYEGDLRHLVSLATVTSGDAVSAFTEALVTAYFEANVAKGNAISTLVTKRVAVVEFARFCLRMRYLALDPTANAPKYKLPHRLPKAFNERERDRLLALTETEKEVWRVRQGIRESSWVRVPLPPAEDMLRAVLYYSGLRAGTVVKIRLQDIQDPQGDQLGSFRIITKGNREIEVPIVPELATQLLHYIAAHTDMRPTSFLFSRRLGLPWTVKMVQHKVLGWGRAAGVVKAHPHRWRHTAARELLDTGATLEETQEFLGHANIASTQIYRRLTSKAVGQAALRRALLMRERGQE